MSNIANAVHLTGAATVDATGALTLNGAISGSSHLTKTGAGTLTIGGAASNANAGGVTINAGTLVFAKAAPAGASGAGTITIGDGAGADALVLGGPNQVTTGAALDVRSSGVVYGNNHFNVVSTLAMSGGAIEQGNFRTTGNVTAGASSNGSRLNGGTLDLAGGVRTFDVTNGAATLDLDVGALVRNGGINKTGDGAMRLASVNHGTLGTTVTAGTLILAHPSAAGAGTFAVGAGGGAIVTAGLPAALRVAGALSITSPGTLDLTDNDMVVDYTGASPVASVRAMLQAGYAGGAWDGVGGIVTADGTSDGFAIGYAEATDVFTAFPAMFSAQSVDDTTLLLRFTRYGDANLDGQVNLQDFNRLAAHFGTGDAWCEGDFNYDGTVNLQDFNRLAANFGLSAAGPEVTPEDWAALASAVPEPAVAVLAGAASTLLVPRRRRR